MTHKVPVSVLIPVKNEKANIARCLESVKWAAEVFVVDSASTDGTQDIAIANGAIVVQFIYKGPWPKKKNWALQNLSFSFDWVLIVDADEVLHQDLEEEIRGIVSDRGSPFVGYWINRRFMFMGQWLRHAYYPNWNLRLFRHQIGRYEKLTSVDTHSGDNEVHEHVVVNGPTARLKGEMDHYAFPSIDVFVEKHNRYSNWEARVATEKLLSTSSAGLQLGSVGQRRRLKRLSHYLPFRPMLRFIYIYFVQGGIWDGKPGYYFARMHAIYEFLCVAKTVELRRNAITARK